MVWIAVLGGFGSLICMVWLIKINRQAWAGQLQKFSDTFDKRIAWSVVAFATVSTLMCFGTAIADMGLTAYVATGASSLASVALVIWVRHDYRQALRHRAQTSLS